MTITELGDLVYTYLHHVHPHSVTYCSEIDVIAVGNVFVDVEEPPLRDGYQRRSRIVSPPSLSVSVHWCGVITVHQRVGREKGSWYDGNSVIQCRVEETIRLSPESQVQTE